MKLVNQFIRALFFYLFVTILFGGGGFLIYYLDAKGYPAWVLWIFFIYFLQVTFSITIFAQGRQNYSKLSWLIVTIIFPIFGHLIFLLFGLRYDDRKSVAKYHQKANFKLEQKVLKNHEGESELDNLFNKQARISNRGVYHGNFELFKHVEKGFNKLFTDLEQAQKFIHIEYYIIKPGEIYEQFKAILIKKAQAGVKVRMIIDDFGNWGMPWYEIGNLRKNGIELRILGKVYFPFIGSKNGYRNHRKLVIIDGHIVHTGGANIADEYVSINKRYGVWIDYQVRITGAIVRSYSLLFLEDWNYVGKPIQDLKKYLLEQSDGTSKGVLIEDTPEVKDEILQDSIVKWILNARRSISISTPYFVPTPAIFNALKIAALSGLDVKLFIPGQPDKKVVYAATKYWSSQLVPYGVKVFKTNDMVIHSKIGLFDEEYAYLGTFNLDFRSMYSQFELATLVQGQIVKDLKNLFQDYEALSAEVKLITLQRSLIREKIWRGFLMFFAPIM